MAEGDFALWSTADDSTTITTAGIVVLFETEEVRDPSLELAVSSQLTISEAGRYLIRWDAAITRNPASASPTRGMVLGRLRLNGTTFLEGGRSIGYWRALEQCFQAGLCSATIVDLEPGDYLELFLQRIDSAGANGSTVMGGNGESASISAWRLKDSWELVDLRCDTNQTPSTTDEQLPTFKVVTAEGGWSGTGSPGDSTLEAIYDPPGSFDLLFLVCFSLEALSSETLVQGLLECVLRWADEIAHPHFEERARVTGFVEGAGTTTRAAPTWVGLVNALSGEEGSPMLQLRYLHRSSTAVEFTPEAGKVRLQAVVIPKADVDYVMVRANAAGQNASVDNSMVFDVADHEGASWDHNPGDESPNKVRASGDGQWAHVFAAGYAMPVGGARADERLLHDMQLRVQNVQLGYASAKGFDRGSSGGCDRSGVCVSGIVRIGAEEDLSLYHDQLAVG